MQGSNPDQNPAPAVGVHPEVARFEREFRRRQLPPDVTFAIEEDSITGQRPNPDWSRLGFTFGLLFALLIGGGIVVWVPVLNVLWAVVGVAALIALPIFGARAAIFRLRQGRTKSFRVVFREAGPKWESDDDEFWKPVKDFFGL
jgi:hypothetical protein